MALMDEALWRGKIYSGGCTSNLEAFTDTRLVTIRSDIATYPF